VRRGSCSHEFDEIAAGENERDKVGHGVVAGVAVAQQAKVVVNRIERRLKWPGPAPLATRMKNGFMKRLGI
jgi:hypothetical protein